MNDYFLIERDEAGNVTDLVPIKAAPVIEGGEIVGYVSVSEAEVVPSSSSDTREPSP